MSDQDVFNQDPKPGETDQSSTSTDVFADQLKQITNEDGKPKYNNVEDALKALNHSQSFIDTLKTEKSQTEARIQELEAELSKRSSVEDVVGKLLNKNTDPNDGNAQADPHGETTLDEKKVGEIVQQLMQQQVATSTAEANVNKVSSTLSEKFGDKAVTMLHNRAKELGTTVDSLKELAKENPNLVLSLFEGGNPTDSNPTSTSTNSSYPKNEVKLEAPEKSLMQGGASNDDIMEYMRQVKEYTYKQLGVEKS